MSRSSLATVVALALAAAALLWARSRDAVPGAGDGQLAAAASSVDDTSIESSPPTIAAEDDGELAKDVVWKMVDASKARDVAAYLDCFGGDLRTRLDATVRELGESGFADYLGRRVGELKGVALYDLELAEGGASLTVEYVYAAEKELQRLHLEESRDRWRITQADASRREKSLIPYGTPIEEVE